MTASPVVVRALSVCDGGPITPKQAALCAMRNPREAVFAIRVSGVSARRTSLQMLQASVGLPPAALVKTQIAGLLSGGLAVRMQSAPLLRTTASREGAKVLVVEVLVDCTGSSMMLLRWGRVALVP